MPEPRQIDFAQLPWEDEAPGIRAQATTHEGSRWAVVEYAPGAHREEWCTDGRWADPALLDRRPGRLTRLPPAG